MTATILDNATTNRPYDPIIEDPLDPDMATDRPILTTRRALCRVATVAAEAGARFQREGVTTDPIGWMLAPRRLFDGGSALEACLERSHFMKAILLHGLGLGLDADPDVFDTVSEIREDSRGRKGSRSKRVPGPPDAARKERLGVCRTTPLPNTTVRGHTDHAPAHL